MRDNDLGIFPYLLDFFNYASLDLLIGHCLLITDNLVFIDDYMVVIVIIGGDWLSMVSLDLLFNVMLFGTNR